MANYCFTDLHGMYNLWQQIRDYASPTDKLYFLGDAMDRGPHGIKILKELLADPRVVFIKGNHEDIFVSSAREYLRLKQSDSPLSVIAEDELYMWFVN